MRLKPLRFATAAAFSVMAVLVVASRFLDVGSPQFGPIKIGGLLVAIIGAEAALTLRGGREWSLCIKQNANFLLAALVTLGGFVLLEMGARWISAPASGVLAKDVAQENSPYQDKGDYYGRYATAAQMEFNDFTGYLPRRNTDGPGYHTNGQFLRYDRDLGPKPPEENRILFTGGSAAWGAGVSQKGVFTALMEQDLGSGARAKIATAGVGGFSSTQERILIENHLYRLRPNVIVMLTGWNDALYGYQGIDILERQNFVDHRQILEREWYGLGAFKRLAPPVYGDYPLKLGLVVDKAVYRIRHSNATEIEAKLKPISLPPGHVYQTFLHNLRLARAVAREYGIELVVCLQPSIYATRKSLNDYERNFLDGTQSSSVGFQSYNRSVYDLYRSRLPEDLAGMGVVFLDGDEAITNESHAVFADNVHLGDRGNRLLADFFMSRLRPWMTP